MSSDRVVSLERFPEERIAVITLDRPPLNAIDEQVVTELAEAAAELTADRETRAVVVRSALEGVFMAGADIHEFERRENWIGDRLEPVTDAEFFDRALLAQEVFSRFAEVPQPTIAAINGHALGGGLELALACDFRFAARAEGALIGLPEVRLGLLPGAGGTQRLTWLVGPARATELIMKGIQLSPEQAAADGIVHFLVEPEELEPKARDYAVRLARQAPIALRGIKRAIRGAWSPDGLEVEREAFREVLASEDAQLGVKAFLEGERPAFSGS
jgi:enoyl-CoA hydratase/carnithine racemase